MADKTPKTAEQKALDAAKTALRRAKGTGDEAKIKAAEDRVLAAQNEVKKQAGRDKAAETPKRTPRQAAAAAPDRFERFEPDDWPGVDDDLECLDGAQLAEAGNGRENPEQEVAPQPETPKPSGRKRAEISDKTRREILAAKAKGREQLADRMLVAHLDEGLSFSQIGSILDRTAPSVRGSMISRTLQLPEEKRRLTWTDRQGNKNPDPRQGKTPRARREPAEREVEAGTEVEPVEDKHVPDSQLPKADESVIQI